MESVVNSSVFVIIPAYNEERVLWSVLQPLIRMNYSIVVVDDGSRDGTWSSIRNLPVYALRHAINLGQGAALSTGMRFAIQQGAELLVHFDADGQHSVEDIGTLLKPLAKKEADIVFGSRFLRVADKELVPPMRRFLLKSAVIVNGLMTGLWLSDAHNGFIALTRTTAQKIRLREKSFAYHSEMLNQVRELGLRYAERPTTIVYSEYSKAKGQPMWNAVNIVLDLVLGRVFR